MCYNNVVLKGILGVIEMKKRKTELMVFNTVLCLIVVLIHLLSQPISRLTPDSMLFTPYITLWRLSTFVVQAFIFVSAVKTFLNGRSESYGKFIVKRLKTILVPYLIAVLLYYLYFVYILEYFPFSVKDYLIYALRGDLAAHFYFIVVIMQFYLLYPVWKFMLNRVRVVPALCVSAILTIVLGLYSPFILDKLFQGYAFPYTDRVFTTYLIYWVGGMYVGKYYNKFITIVRGKKIVYILVFLIAAAADVKLVLMNRQGIAAPLHLDMIHSIYCVAAIMMLIKLSCKFVAVMRGPLKVIDASSYYIYLYHVLFIFVLDNNVLKNVSVSSLTLQFLLRTVIIYAACMVLAYVCKLWRLPAERRRGISV